MSSSSFTTIFRPLNRMSRSLRLAELGNCGRRTLTTTSTAQGISKLPRLQHTIPESYKEVEVSTAEWSFVERLIPPKAIPKPNVKPGEVTPSGWVAPSAAPGDYPYFVSRSASHMLPVYVKHEPIMSRFTTTVKNVEGDVFTLGEELRQYLSDKFPFKHINLRVHEPHRMIQIKGEYVLEVREYLIRKGF
ncbi:39S ribosomal protein L49, mitochondrial-like isoform X2 [Penaeus japonicus]|uniref:39S ribosomal protein L49, mitochondrial-like isoform X2 n=1 Tax=Penaeus japonicus TaxID=27405 RepID=UPI001C711201|nr:39S ribosomal protein L49, mitochondrial-like isoform X2 [Penaeus japonicus]